MHFSLLGFHNQVLCGKYYTGVLFINFLKLKFLEGAVELDFAGYRFKLLFLLGLYLTGFVPQVKILKAH